MSPSLKACAAGVVAAAQLAAVSGCAASKGASDGSPTSPSVSQAARIRASDVLTGAAIRDATVAGSGVTGGTTDSNGLLTLMATSASTFAIDITSSSYIPRNTLLKIPGADAGVSLIPNTLDLPAFDCMFRNSPLANDVCAPSGLQRWTTTPALRIISNVVQFNASGPTYAATSEGLTSEEIQKITADLSYGLPLLSGGVFQAFAGVTNQVVVSGEAVTLLSDGSITFARCSGLNAARGSAGYGQWQFRTDDVVTGGMLCIDRDFDLSGSTLGLGVRLHELGHALGYKHIKAEIKRDVLMNPMITINDLSPWDRDVAKIAFQRPTGNRTPDTDPATFSTNRLTTHIMTVDGCRVRH
jgi:hypothetical protein